MERKICPKFSCIKFFQIWDVPTQILGRPGHSLLKTREKGHLHKVFGRDIPTSGSRRLGPWCPRNILPKKLIFGFFSVLNKEGQVQIENLPPPIWNPPPSTDPQSLAKRWWEYHMMRSRATNFNHVIGRCKDNPGKKHMKSRIVVRSDSNRHWFAAISNRARIELQNQKPCESLFKVLLIFVLRSVSNRAIRSISDLESRDLWFESLAAQETLALENIWNGWGHANKPQELTCHTDASTQRMTTNSGSWSRVSEVCTFLGCGGPHAQLGTYPEVFFLFLGVMLDLGAPKSQIAIAAIASDGNSTFKSTSLCLRCAGNWLTTRDGTCQ